MHMNLLRRKWLLLLVLVGINLIVGVGLSFLPASTVGALLALLVVVVGGVMLLARRR